MVKPVHLPIFCRPFAGVQRIEGPSGEIQASKEGLKAAARPRSGTSKSSADLLLVAAFGCDATPARSGLWLQSRAPVGTGATVDLAALASDLSPYLYIYIFIYLFFFFWGGSLLQLYTVICPKNPILYY